MRAEGGGCEQVLPTPLTGCVWPFAHQRFGHVNVPRADREVLEVFFAEAVEVLLEPLLKGDRQSDHAMSSSLAVVNGDGALADSLN